MFQAMNSLLNNVWNFIDGVPVPGLGFSFGVLLIGFAFTLVTIRLIVTIFGIATSSVKSSGRHSRNARVSKERAGDEK